MKDLRRGANMKVGISILLITHGILAVFLLGALWRSDELVIGACRDCGAVRVLNEIEALGAAMLIALGWFRAIFCI